LSIKKRKNEIFIRHLLNCLLNRIINNLAAKSVQKQEEEKDRRVKSTAKYAKK